MIILIIRVSTSLECLARDIMEVARAIRRLPSVRVVMVKPIITRMVGCRRTPADFEQKRHRVNDIVRALQSDLAARRGVSLEASRDMPRLRHSV